MQRVKAHELRQKDEAALVEELTKHRKNLAELRVSKVSSQPQVKLSKIRQVRKSIAKVLTVINEKKISAARTQFKNAKYAPKDLRQKKTRAFRRKLTKFEAKKQTIRAQKKADNNKLRKYALAA